MDIFAKASPQFIFWPVNMSYSEILQDESVDYDNTCLWLYKGYF